LLTYGTRIKHYEIAEYGTARTYAELLGDDKGAELLNGTLEEERATDEKLSALASSINVGAVNS
jgi:ferritin-like metal-binding protein YciE